MKAIFTDKNKQYSYDVVNGYIILIRLGKVSGEKTNQIDNETEYEKLTNEEWDYIFREYNELYTEQ